MHTDLNFNGKTVLVTGGAGFIGSNLALHIEDVYPDCRVVVLEGFDLGHFQNLRGFRGECISGDISQADDLRRLADLPFDYLFHQAAISDTTVTDQRLVVRVNTNAFGDLLDLAVERNAPVVYASSAGVYGNSPAPNTVGHGEAPENIYGFSKLMMDHLAAQYVKQHGLPIVGLRYFNVYGPREQYKGTTASMILQLARQLLDGRRPRLFKHGQQRRDFVYVEDVVQANMKAIAYGQSGVFNVGSGQARSFNDLVEILGRELGLSGETEYVDNPWSFYQNHTEAEIGPTCEKLDYQPNFSLEEGVRAYLPEILRICGKELEPCTT